MEPLTCQLRTYVLGYNLVQLNLPESKAGVNYTYGDANHDHAVTQMGIDTFTYDANGNQVTRNMGGNSYTLSYDAENRLVGVNGAATASFVYDGDGTRVKGTIGSTTTTYIGNYFEWKTSTSDMIKYYYAGNTRVAMRTGSNTLNYLIGDHLGSTVITTDSSGSRTAEIRYYPWGTERYTYQTTPTSYHFTGQRLESEIGLYFYGARWYDAQLGRFIQPDYIVPEKIQGVQAWDRLAYANNNPVRYTDPTGHCIGPLAIICVALIEYAPEIIEFVTYAVTAYIVSDQIANNPTTINGEQVNIGIIIPPGPSFIPELPEISNPVPDRLSRVIPEKFASTTETLGPYGMNDVFVTAAEDIRGITTSEELSNRLTLLDNNGNPLQGPFAIMEFDTPSEGIASPILRNNPGFIGRGRTAGGAREFVVPNFRLEDLKNLLIWRIK